MTPFSAAPPRTVDSSSYCSSRSPARTPAIIWVKWSRGEDHQGRVNSARYIKWFPLLFATKTNSTVKPFKKLESSECSSMETVGIHPPKEKFSPGSSSFDEYHTSCFQRWFSIRPYIRWCSWESPKTSLLTAQFALGLIASRGGPLKAYASCIATP